MWANSLEWSVQIEQLTLMIAMNDERGKVMLQACGYYCGRRERKGAQKINCIYLHMALALT